MVHDETPSNGPTLKPLTKSSNVEPAVKSVHTEQFSHLEERDCPNHHRTTMNSTNEAHTHNPQAHAHAAQPIQRPLATYTCLGSPIHPVCRVRKMSIGNNPSLSPTLRSRARSNSHSITNGGATSFILPLPAAMSNELVNTHSPFHTTSSIYEGNFTTLNEESSTDLSEDRRNAIEAAYASEKTRQVELEKAEMTMTADELRHVLKRERTRTAMIQSDFAAVRYGMQYLYQGQGGILPIDDGGKIGPMTRPKRKHETS
jgi:hypothetical protein